MNGLTLPQSIEQEQAVLGSVIIDPDKYFELEGLIAADDFYVHRNGWVWEAFVSLAKNKTPIDLLTLTDEIDRRGQLLELGGAAYLTKLLNSAPSSSNALAYAKTVKDTSIRRKLILAAQKALGHAENESISALEAVEQVQRDLSNLQVGASDTDIETIREIAVKFDDAKDRGEKLSMYPAQSVELNRILGGGLWAGRVALLAGEYKLGKTILGVRILTEILEANRGISGLFISQEMGKRDTLIRYISALGKIPEDLLQLGKLENYEINYGEAIARLEKLRLYMSQRSHWSMDALRAEIMKQARENDMRLVVVDHVKLLADNPNTPRAAAYEQLDWKTQELKAIAKDANVAILAIYTLNAQGELSGGAAPQYNVDLALKLMSDAEYQEKRVSPLERQMPEETTLWLTEEYRRYGRFESAVRLRKDTDYPVIHDYFTPRGMQ